MNNYQNYLLSILLLISIIVPALGQDDIAYEINHILAPSQAGSITVGIMNTGYLQGPYDITCTYPDGTVVNQQTNGQLAVFPNLILGGSYCFHIVSANGCVSDDCVSMLICQQFLGTEICQHIPYEDGPGDVVVFGGMGLLGDGTTEIEFLDYSSDITLDQNDLIVLYNQTDDEIGNTESGNSSGLPSNNIPAELMLENEFVAIFTKETNGDITMDEFWLSNSSSLISSNFENAIKNNVVKLFPNPSSDIINLVSTQKNIESIQVIDLSGRVLRESHGIGSLTHQYSVKSLSQGVLIFKITFDDATEVYEKIIIIH